MSYFNERALQILNDKQFYKDLITTETKVQLLLEACTDAIKSSLEEFIPSDSTLLKFSPKITRGNNFLGYPWTIVDFPRNFESDGFLALRTLCLRGHYFSCTLHLSGNVFKHYSKRLEERFQEIPGEYYVSINADEWMHIIDEKNYEQIKENDKELESKIKSSEYIKIARKITFEEAESLPAKTAEMARILFTILH